MSDLSSPPSITSQGQTEALIQRLRKESAEWVEHVADDDFAAMLDQAADALAAHTRQQCPTHGDPLVCLACEAAEEAEWQKRGLHTRQREKLRELVEKFTGYRDTSERARLDARSEGLAFEYESRTAEVCTLNVVLSELAALIAERTE